MNLDKHIEFKTSRLETLSSLDYDFSGLNIEKAKEDLMNEIAYFTVFNYKLKERNL